MGRTKKTLKIGTHIVLILIIMSVVRLNLTVLPLYASVPGEPHDADSMWVEPSTIELSTDTHSIGYKFNVTVWVNLTVTCGAWQFKMLYNKNHLDCTGCGYTAGGSSQFFENVTIIPLDPMYGSYNGTHSYVMHGESWFMGDMKGPGYGSLSWVEFEVVAEPLEGKTLTSLIDIAREVATTQTFVLDENGVPISLTVSNGIYEFASPAGPTPPPEARLYVDPPNITDPTMTPCSVFYVNITVDDVVDLTVCEFNLSYNPVVLGWLSIEFLKVLDQIPTPKMTLDDEAGFGWVKLTYSVPITIEDPVPLIRIMFHVDAMGISVLDLHNTQLTDSEGQPIDHRAEDGLFCTQIRDVAITSVIPSCNWIYPGWEVNINVTAKNKGDINETFTVITYYNQSQIANFTIHDLPPENETTIPFIWNTNNVTGCFNYTISAYASPVPYELNITDNEYIDGEIKVRLMGDVNDDGIVNVTDMLEASKAFGSFPGRENWNSDVDIYRDLVINIMDIYYVAKNFGKECAS